MENSKIANILVLAAVSILVVSAIAVSPVVEADSQDSEDVIDLGAVWSQTAIFTFKGYDATSVTWNFGDGTPEVTDWSVTHTYEKTHTYEDPGVYLVTQTAHNDLGDSKQVYRITIYGYPYVEFVSNGGSDVDTIRMTSGGINATAATEPEEPTRNGYSFTGWYTDSECTQPYDWSTKVVEPITLYAGWLIDGSELLPDDPVEDKDDASDDGSETDWVAIALIIIGIIIAAISVLAISAIGSIGAVGALIGIIVVIVGIAKFVGVF